MTAATTAHETPLGRAEVAWEINGGQMTVTVTIPDGATARVVLPQHPAGRVDEVAGGQHRWEYEVPPTVRPRYSLETPMSDLTADETVWKAVSAVFAKHFPEHVGGSGDSGGVGAFGKSLRDVLVLIPGDKAALEADLLAALDVA